MRKTRDHFASEFHADADFKHQLSTKFRPERKGLVALLDPTTSKDDRLAEGVKILRRRCKRLDPVIAELKACAEAGVLSVGLTELAPSYLHMHANRMLRSAHRAQELVLYDFLARVYDSETARSNTP